MEGKLNKHESKYFNSACLMDEALLFLLEKKEFAYITVKEICTKAGVNRSTFYLHYENTCDLLNETLAYITKKFEAKFIPPTDVETKPEPLEDLLLITPKYIIPYLEFLKEYRRVYVASMSQTNVFGVNKYSGRVQTEIIAPVLRKMNVPEAERKYMLAFYINGLHSLVFEWVKNGCKEDVNYICGLMIKYVPGADSGND